MTAQLLTNECNLIDQLYNPRTLQLGRLCSRGHDFNGTGQSLRWMRSRGCWECEKIGERENRRAKGIVPAGRISSNYHYQDTGNKVVCTRCGGSRIWVRGTIKNPDKKRFQCNDCERSFTVNLVSESAVCGKPKPRSGSAIKQEQPKLEKPKAPVYAKMNNVQTEWFIIRELKKDSLTAREIATNINAPLSVVKTILLELYNEEGSCLTFNFHDKKFTLHS